MQYENSRRFATEMDRKDPLREFRNRFHRPKLNGKSAIYFAGNSLGLQPKSAKAMIDEELADWARLGVGGHVHARHPWVNYHRLTKSALASITGAKPVEVVAMNHLTVNLHLLMVSFYRPTERRFKILCEAGAFPSDQYALESQLRFHGLNADDALLEIKPRPGEACLQTRDILNAIDERADEIALVLFSGVQYYTGQFFNIQEITRSAHKAGAMVGFDLAHAIGNVTLSLHDDNVDFAVWCSYKYLNSGPGAIGGAFVHERHAESSLPRFAGWWGHNENERFQMKKGFLPMKGVDGWQLSNHPVLPAAVHLAALEIIQEAGMENLRKKSLQLTGYLAFLLNSIDQEHRHFQIITPPESDERGCQLSLLMKKNGRRVFEQITQAGIVADWREPDVIRVAPVPLYNTFVEVFRFAQIFKSAVKKWEA